MNKILEAIKPLIPEDKLETVEKAIKESVRQVKSKLESEYDSKLEEAYAELVEDKKEAEKVAYQGYEEAHSIINDLRNRLEAQKNEYEQHMEEQYEEAFKMIKKEESRNENIELELYEEFQTKLDNMKEYMVDKVDQFLQEKGKEIYESARHDVVNDPRLVEHKVALNKIVETVSDYISDEDYAAATSSKLDELTKEIESLRSKVKMQEARNVRLSVENNKLNEQVREATVVIKEHVHSDKNERAEKARKVEGRGRKVNGDELIVEGNQPKTDDNDNDDDANVNADLHEWQVLSGIKQD